MQRVDTAIGEHQQRAALAHRERARLAERVERMLERRRAPRNREEHRERARARLLVGECANARALCGREYRTAHAHATRVRRIVIEQVRARPNVHPERHHQLFADRVDRGIGDLREMLCEVVEEQSRLVREHRQRRIRAHRSNRLLSIYRHGREHHSLLLGRVRERRLLLE